jgi:hypothetical protein
MVIIVLRPENPPGCGLWWFNSPRHCPTSYGSAQGVINNQEKNGANDRDKKTIDIQAGDSRVSEHLENVAADHSSDDAQNYIKQDPLPALIDKLTGNETRN